MLKAKSSEKNTKSRFAKFASLPFWTIRHAGLVRARGLKFSGLLKLSYYLCNPQKVPHRLLNGAVRGRQSWYFVSKSALFKRKLGFLPYISGQGELLKKRFGTPEIHPNRGLGAKFKEN